MAHLPLYVAFLSPFNFAIQSNEKVVLSKFYFNAINGRIPRVGMFYFCVCIKIAGARTEWSTICRHCGVSQTEMLTIRLKLQWSTFPRVQLSISETMITRRWRIKTYVVTHITIASNEYTFYAHIDEILLTLDTVQWVFPGLEMLCLSLWGVNVNVHDVFHCCPCI